MRWDGKPFCSLDWHYRERFGGKVYKLSLNGGMTCPNRDGTIGSRGCIFCSQGGSGDFAPDDFVYSAGLGRSIPNIPLQIEKAKSLVENKLPKNGFAGYIAYFQAYTNTYSSVRYLERIFTEAIAHEDIVALSVATRPDCLEPEKVELLSKLNRIKPVYVELGLQTIKSSTAVFIRRGYALHTFEDAFYRLKAAGINVVVHIILGLPGETHDDMLASCRYLAHIGADGIKLQLLHVLKDTDLAAMYGSFKVMELEEYTSLVVSIIETLPPDMVIHRITGDGPKKLLIAPDWSRNKKNVLNTMMKEFAARNTWQGKYYGC